MFGEKCNPNVVAEISASWPPINGPELHEHQLLPPVKHPARYRLRSAEILDIFVSFRGRRGHAIRFTFAGVELSLSGIAASER
jgi:hypothetical protein